MTSNDFFFLHDMLIELKKPKYQIFSLESNTKPKKLNSLAQLFGF